MISHLDHLVLTSRNVSACIDFYTRILGMKAITFGGDRQALIFGNQKINIHEYGKELEPKAHQPQPGALDLCFVVNESVADIMTHLHAHNVYILEGPVRRTGAIGVIISVYIRDPDLNLIELAVYEQPDLP
ncbi:VOC family protein [Salmonella enterica]|uniref:VOC family protein n=1 Tax=Salmonella enterica TaxID=28901 RepID=A0A5V5HMA2_SALER|nr:VOC family protein [Salmonella enterica]EBV0858496.1 VOC family protein [Salmonella enterica subsp. enterica serovar Anecho]ECG1298746.1 VOC family protein [Salmonella enterica subsp. enterica]ECT9455128.1 VOC family protein [Salmonella enterica subsp. enterica serovar Oskarshamn]EDR5682594.1 VOC family protein [Salmonella enterica subsp. enterica serovar Nima]EHA4239920.1 VOC family protein [Salmonella enterica subsp. enterica serovar Litchfield]